MSGLAPTPLKPKTVVSTVEESGERRSFELRLAKKLARRRNGFKSWTGLSEANSSSTDSAIQFGAVAENLAKLMGADGNPMLQPLSAELISALSYGAELRLQLQDSSDRRFGEHLQLAAMLPIYLNVDADRLGSFIGDALGLAREAIIILELNQVLDGELLKLASSDRDDSIDPRQVIKTRLEVDITRTATNSFALTSESISGRLDDRTKNAYWLIAEQLFGTGSHLHLPPQLDVGKVVWPRVRSHWQQLNELLLKPVSEGASRQPSTPAELPFLSGHESGLSTAAKIKESNSSESSPPIPAALEHEFIEIRSANDPRLAETLSIQLDRCRYDGVSLGLAVYQTIDADLCVYRGSTGGGKLTRWHKAILDGLQPQSSESPTRGFISDCGELAIVFEELDRTELTTLVRDTLQRVEDSLQPTSGLVEASKVGLVAGVACVDSPSKRFKIEQLIEAGWRCLSGAKNQGPGSVKSIEVY